MHAEVLNQGAEVCNTTISKVGPLKQVNFALNTEGYSH